MIKTRSQKLTIRIEYITGTINIVDDFTVNPPVLLYSKQFEWNNWKNNIYNKINQNSTKGYGIFIPERIIDVNTLNSLSIVDHFEFSPEMKYIVQKPIYKDNLRFPGQYETIEM